MKALIVEPSRLIAMMLGNVMEKHAIESVVMRSAGEALEAMAHKKFDLICFAYVLSDMDGIEFIRVAKERDLLGNRPVLMFAATHDKERIDQALHAGVTECFSKHQMKELDKFIGRFTAASKLKISGRVLMVEDSATAALFCLKALVHIGLEVDHVKSAEEAIAKFGANKYDLVLTDYVLSGMETGMAVIRAIREANGRKADTPILAMSGLKDAARRVEILRSGANDFVGKPIVAEELEVRVYNLIMLQRLMQRLEKQHETMRDIAIHDPLTALYNRNYLHERLPDLIATAQAEAHPFAIAIVDIDHFKLINDTHGHAIGDQVLMRIANAMQSMESKKTFLARFGGEEFIAVLINISQNDAVAWAEALRRHIAELYPNGLKVTASFGVAELGPQETFETLFSRADQAVYRAKSLGRNRVELAPPLS